MGCECAPSLPSALLRSSSTFAVTAASFWNRPVSKHLESQILCGRATGATRALPPGHTLIATFPSGADGNPQSSALSAPFLPRAPSWRLADHMAAWASCMQSNASCFQREQPHGASTGSAELLLLPAPFTWWAATASTRAQGQQPPSTVDGQARKEQRPTCVGGYCPGRSCPQCFFRSDHVLAGNLS